MKSDKPSDETKTLTPFQQFFISERNMMIIILLNAVVIFALYFPSVEKHYALWYFLEIIDQVIVFIFLIEALVKLYVYKPKEYFASGWNRFDFFIILGSLPSLFAHLIIIPNTQLLIILRLFRVVRLVRFIRFVPNLNQVITGLGRALRASVFVLMALLFMNFMLAIFTCHLYRNIAPEFFGDPLISAFSIFQMFTVEGWNEIADTIATRTFDETKSNWLLGLTRFYFVVVVLLGGIFGMSLANAVFVDEMTMDNNSVLEEKIDRLTQDIQALKEALDQRDR